MEKLVDVLGASALQMNEADDDFLCFYITARCASANATGLNFLQTEIDSRRAGHEQSGMD